MDAVCGAVCVYVYARVCVLQLHCEKLDNALIKEGLPEDLQKDVLVSTLAPPSCHTSRKLTPLCMLLMSLATTPKDR